MLALASLQSVNDNGSVANFRYDGPVYLSSLFTLYKNILVHAQILSTKDFVVIQVNYYKLKLIIVAGSQRRFLHPFTQVIQLILSICLQTTSLITWNRKFRCNNSFALTLLVLARGDIRIHYCSMHLVFQQQQHSAYLEDATEDDATCVDALRTSMTAHHDYHNY